MKRMMAVAALMVMSFVMVDLTEPGQEVQSTPIRMSLVIAPEKINVQGVLTDDMGNPLNTTVSMSFKIYAAASGGTALWTETHGSVMTVGGFFDVLLGSEVAFQDGLFSSPGRWLGITVGTDTEMVPRQQIVSSAYALYANEAALLDGKEATDFAAASHDHDGRYFQQGQLNTNDGTVNQPADPVSWSKIKDMPSGFADGTDEVGAAGGISQISAGTGILVTNPTGSTATVAANIGIGAGQVAAGNHNHDTTYVNEDQINSVTSDMIADTSIQLIDLHFYPVLSVIAGNGLTGGGYGHDVTLNVKAGGGINVMPDSMALESDYLYGTAYDSLFVNEADLDHLDARDGSPANALYVDNDGKVGIGTTSPNANLYIEHSNPVMALNTTSTSNAAVRFAESGSNKWTVGYAPGDNHLFLYDYSGGGNALVIKDGNGRVGLGTTSPQGALDVTSTTGGFIVPRMTTTQRNSVSPVNGMIIYNTTTNQFNFYENGAWVTK